MNDGAERDDPRGRECSTSRGFVDGSVGRTRLGSADNDASSDPAFYIKCPDQEVAGMRGWSNA